MNNGLKEFGSFIILGQLLTIITQLRTTVDIMPVVDILFYCFGLKDSMRFIKRATELSSHSKYNMQCSALLSLLFA